MFDARGADRFVTRLVVFGAVFVAVGDFGFVFLAVVGDLGLATGLDVVSASCWARLEEWPALLALGESGALVMALIGRPRPVFGGILLFIFCQRLAR